MCLAVPGKIVTIDEADGATVDMLGVQRPISLRLTPSAAVGDYVLVHAGFGIQIVDPAEAEETLKLIRELPELLDEDLAAEVPAPEANTAPAAAADAPAISGGAA